MRALATRLGLRPTKALGQNFVVDPNTVRRVVAAAALPAGCRVLEVGPGLGSLTLALLEAGHGVVALEKDPLLAGALAATVAARLPPAPDGAPLDVVTGDALAPPPLPGDPPDALVANLPYNVAVPVLLTVLERLPSVARCLVMVQAEVADRLTAAPGSRVYGVPTAKLAWWAQAQPAGRVPRTVFWPVPNVDSALVLAIRRGPPSGDRAATFAVIDAAFSSRRKTLRAALAGWAGSPVAAEEALRRAGVDPGARGEQLGVTDFARIAAAR